jgi:hypothetical protein
MLIELLTPLVIASAPIAITIPDEIKYDHASQLSVVVAWDGTPQPYTKTPNGTRTFSGNGTPIDSDND